LKQHEAAIGPKRTSLVAPHTSAFGGKADILEACSSHTFARFMYAAAEFVLESNARADNSRPSAIPGTSTKA